MRCLSPFVFASVMLALGGCSDGSLATGTGGAHGGLPTGGAIGIGGAPATGGAVAMGGSLATGGAVATGGSLSPGAGGAGAALGTGGAVGTGGAPSTGVGGADAALVGGGEVGAGGAPFSEVALATGGRVSSGGAVGTGGASASGGAVGPVDVREEGVDSGGEAAAGGRSGQYILDLVPIDNTVSGWTVDRQSGAGLQPRTATTQEGVMDLIDGAAEGFFIAPYTPKVFAWQSYVNSTLATAPEGASLSLYVLQMPSAEQAAGLYRALLQEALYSRRAGTPDDWQPITPRVGAESRVQDTGDTWWVNFHQDVFYVEIMVAPSYGPPPDYSVGNAVTKAEALRFARAVAGRI